MHGCMTLSMLSLLCHNSRSDEGSLGDDGEPKKRMNPGPPLSSHLQANDSTSPARPILVLLSKWFQCSEHTPRWLHCVHCMGCGNQGIESEQFPRPAAFIPCAVQCVVKRLFSSSPRALTKSTTARQRNRRRQARPLQNRWMDAWMGERMGQSSRPCWWPLHHSCRPRTNHACPMVRLLAAFSQVRYSVLPIT